MRNSLFLSFLLSSVPAAAADIFPLPELPPVASPLGKAIVRAPAAPETAKPDVNNDGNDAHRLQLLTQGDRWTVPTSSGGILLVVEKGYLNDAQLDRVAADLQEASVEIPRLTGRPSLIRGRFTVYVYDRGPMSEADVPGAQPGEKGLMLRLIKEEKDPLFHEMTHLLAGYSKSQSMAEGIADWVQDKLRPGRAHAFVPANTNPHVIAKAAVARWSPDFLTTIGAPGFWFGLSGRAIRLDFYYCSWSFADFLLRQGDMKAFWSVADEGGKPEAYLKAYGRTYDDLIKAWLSEVNRSTP